MKKQIINELVLLINGYFSVEITAMILNFDRNGSETD